MVLQRFCAEALPPCSLTENTQVTELKVKRGRETKRGQRVVRSSWVSSKWQEDVVTYLHSMPLPLDLPGPSSSLTGGRKSTTMPGLMADWACLYLWCEYIMIWSDRDLCSLCNGQELLHNEISCRAWCRSWRRPQGNALAVPPCGSPPAQSNPWSWQWDWNPQPPSWIVTRGRGYFCPFSSPSPVNVRGL